MRCGRIVGFLVLAIALVAGLSSVAHASCTSSQQSCSTNYGVGETYFGSGGNAGCSTEGSTHYCVQSSAGDLSIGNSTNGVSSGKYQIQAGGTNTSRAPSLALVVNAATTPDLGYLQTASVKTDTATFSVQSYLAGSYIVQTVGNPPTNNTGHQLAPITTSGGGSSSAGTEQFGINLTANTSPATMGAGPSCQVSGFCNLSTITLPTNYGTANQYYYHNGDTIASSASSSSQTNYTISYIFNISPNTPDGQYTLNQAIVVTSTF